MAHDILCAGQSCLVTAAGQYMSHTSRPMMTGRLNTASPTAYCISTSSESQGVDTHTATYKGWAIVDIVSISWCETRYRI